MIQNLLSTHLDITRLLATTDPIAFDRLATDLIEHLSSLDYLPAAISALSRTPIDIEDRNSTTWPSLYFPNLAALKNQLDYLLDSEFDIQRSRSKRLHALRKYRHDIVISAFTDYLATLTTAIEFFCAESNLRKMFSIPDTYICHIDPEFRYDFYFYRVISDTQFYNFRLLLSSSDTYSGRFATLVDRSRTSYLSRIIWPEDFL